MEFKCVWPNQLAKVPQEPIFEAVQFDRHCRIKYAKQRAKATAAEEYRAEF
ncbi:MAG: hypothetical protein RB191_08860 [Terriglobia bacterium]|nr:hypothetical protein [Terriglobia bacterium]